MSRTEDREHGRASSIRPSAGYLHGAASGMVLALAACAAGISTPRTIPSRSAPAASASTASPASSSDTPRPPTVPLRDVQLPTLSEHAMANGMMLWHVADRTVPLVHVRLVVDAGSYDDGSKPGLALLTALALARGAPASLGEGKGPPLVADRMRVDVSGESTVFSVDVLEREAKDTLALFGAMVGHAAFRQIDTEAARRLAGARASAAPGWQMADALRRSAAGASAPNDQAVQPMASAGSMTGLDIQTFYRTHYGSKRARLIVVGRMDLDETLRAAESSFGSWSGAPAAERGAREAGSVNPTIVLFDEPTAVSAEVLALAQSPAASDASWPASWLAATIVRAGARADCAGMPQFVGMSPVVAGRPPLFPFCLAAPAADAPAALRELLDDARGLGERAPSDATMLAARKSALDALAVPGSSDAGIASLLTVFAQSAAPPSLWTDAGAKLRAVAPGDVATAAKTYLAPAQWFIAVRGPASSMREQLARIGSVREAR